MNFNWAQTAIRDGEERAQIIQGETIKRVDWIHIKGWGEREIFCAARNRQSLFQLDRTNCLWKLRLARYPQTKSRELSSSTEGPLISVFARALWPHSKRSRQLIFNYWTHINEPTANWLQSHDNPTISPLLQFFCGKQARKSSSNLDIRIVRHWCTEHAELRSRMVDVEIFACKSEFLRLRS